MREEVFIAIKDNLEKFRYTSMTYTEFEDICDYDIICNTEQFVLIGGLNNNARMYEYCWAANSAEDIIDYIDKEQCLITFIPDGWVNLFEHAGFRIRSVWRDFFKPSLTDISNEVDYAIELHINECKEASEVTISCRNQSRGFTGESDEFFRDWLSDSDENNRHNTVFVEKNEKGELVGLVCTTVYGYDSAKGPVSWIREVCVRPEYQNRGIGRKLIMQALSHGKKHGATRAFLAADEVNENAIHLYKRIGFEPSQGDGQIDMIRL